MVVDIGIGMSVLIGVVVSETGGDDKIAACGVVV